MSQLGAVIGSITLLVMVWTIIENVLFVKGVLVNSKGYDEKTRKTTKILFFISTLLAAVMITICFCLYNTAYTFVIYVNLIYFFFIILHFLIVLWMIIELVTMLASKRKQKQDGENEPERKSKKIFPILFVDLVVIIFLRLVLMKILETLSYK